MIRVALADDHPIVLDGLTTIVEQDADITVCAQTSSIDQIVPLIERHRPDVIVLDLVFAGGPPRFDILQTIHRRFESAPILVLSMHLELEYVRCAFDSGAFGYLPKGEASRLICGAIRSVATGTRYLSPMIVERIGDRWGGVSVERRRNGGTVTMTRREMEVFALIGEGLTLSDIAVRLGVSTSIVGSHTERMKKKLSVSGTNELRKIAIENKVLGPNPLDATSL